MQVFDISKEGWALLKEALKKLDGVSKYCIAIIDKKKARSLQQNKWYWSTLLPAIHYFLKDEYNIKNLDILHDTIKLIVSELYYPECIYYIKSSKGVDVIHSNLSTAFDKMSREKFNQYLDNLYECLGYFITFTPLDLNDLVRHYCMQVGKQYKEFN